MNGMPWPSFWLSLVLSAAITPAVIALAHRLGLVARSREDRWWDPARGEGPSDATHRVRRPPALMGGAAMPCICRSQGR